MILIPELIKELLTQRKRFEFESLNVIPVRMAGEMLPLLL